MEEEPTRLSLMIMNTINHTTIQTNYLIIMRLTIIILIIAIVITIIIMIVVVDVYCYHQ